MHVLVQMAFLVNTVIKLLVQATRVTTRVYAISPIPDISAPALVAFLVLTVRSLLAHLTRVKTAELVS